MKLGKILVVGAGRVGTSAAYAMILQNIGREIRLVDVDQQHLTSESMDLRDAKYFSFTEHVHKGTWEDAKDAHIIVICAGEVLRPGSNHEEVLNTNKKIFDNIFHQMGNNLSQNCIIVVVTSPVDAMTYYAQQLSGLPRNQVFGTGTLLDTQRLRVKFAKKFGINEKSIHAYVLGEQGDSEFVPWSHATIAGRFLFDYFGESRDTQERLLEEFAAKARDKSKEILKGKAGTEFGIGSCIAWICRNVIYDTKIVVPLSCYVQEYGVCLSILCTLGELGIAKYLPLELTEREKHMFRKCAHNVQRNLDVMGVKREERKIPTEGEREAKGEEAERKEERKTETRISPNISDTLSARGREGGIGIAESEKFEIRNAVPTVQETTTDAIPTQKDTGFINPEVNLDYPEVIPGADKTPPPEEAKLKTELPKEAVEGLQQQPARKQEGEAPTPH